MTLTALLISFYRAPLSFRVTMSDKACFCHWLSLLALQSLKCHQIIAKSRSMTFNY